MTFQLKTKDVILIKIEHTYVFVKLMISVARSSELYIIPNVIVKKMISNKDKPNILSLFGGETWLSVLLFLFFSP